MKNILSFLFEGKKWSLILALAYFLLSSAIIYRRKALYCYIAPLRATPLGDLPLDLFLATLLLLGLVCCIDLIRRPWYISRRVTRTLQRWNISNSLGEFPTLKCVRKSPYKQHELVLELNGKGLSLVDMDKHREHWQAGLNGAIRLEYGRKNSTILLYFLPRKYVKPTIISPKDDAIGPISLRDLINLEIIGSTGSGKTFAGKILLFKISQFRKESKIWLLDFKQFDFRDFAGLPRYYGYTDCLQGLNDYYAAFKAQQKIGIAGEPNYLFIDEWGSFIMSLDHKTAEQAKHLLAELLMLGRAYNFIPIIGIQRPDASYFNGGRDNFQACLALGNLSPEGRRMAFPDSVKEEITNCKKREGHLYIDGIGLEKIKIEEIPDMDVLDTSIREAMEHGGRRSVSESRPGAAR